MPSKDPGVRRAHNKAHYEKNKHVYIARNLRRKQEFRAIVHAAKDRPCADCGVAYPYYVMDFDHREDEEKIFNIGNAHTIPSTTKLLAEIAKCDVVCSNCHRQRTHDRKALSGVV